MMPLQTCEVSDMALRLADEGMSELIELVKLEKQAFAAKLRMARSVLGWSQSEFGFRVGLTQRAVHKIEQGDTEPRRTTVRAIEQLFHDEKLEFEDLADGGFRVTIRVSVLERPVTMASRRRRAVRRQLGVIASGRRIQRVS